MEFKGSSASRPLAKPIPDEQAISRMDSNPSYLLVAVAAKVFHLSLCAFIPSMMLCLSTGRIAARWSEIQVSNSLALA